MFTHLSHALLALTTLLPAQTPPKPAPPRLELDEIVRDRMSIHDAPIHTPTLDTYYVKAPTVGRRFTFEAPETRRYEISHISYFYDSYLTVRTPDGKLLAENDDGPVAGHALLAFNAEEGNTYIIEAGALHGHAGPYEVVVRRAKLKRNKLNQPWHMEQYVLDERQRLAAYEVEYGEYYPGTALARANVGAAYFRTYQRPDALHYFRSALVPYEYHFGPTHKNVGVLLDNIALASVDLNEYELAEGLQRRAIGTLRNLDPVPLGNLARSYHNLGRTLMRSGKYAEARSAFEESLQVSNATSDNHPLARISTLAAIALCCAGLGDTQAADNAIAAAKDLAAVVPDHLHLDNAIIGLRVSEIQHLLSVDKAKEARAIAEDLVQKLRAAPALGLPLSISILATCCLREGNYELALSLQEEALQLHIAQHGPNHLESLKIRQNMVVTLTVLGHLETALQHARATRDLAVANLGPIHPLTVTSYEVLAEVQQLSGDIEGAVDTTLVELNNRLTMLLNGIPSLAEHERLLYAGQHRQSIGRLVSLAIEHPAQVSIEAAYGQVLTWKGLVSRGLIQDREWLRENPEHVSFTRRHSPGATTGKVSRLESRLKPSEIRKRLGEEQALLDFLVYVDHETKTEKVACFVAVDESFSVLDLGLASEVTRKITFYTDTLLQASPLNIERAGKAVYESLWAPLRSAIRSRTKITVNPDGPITHLPLGAILDDRGHFLIEDYTFSYCDSIARLRPVGVRPLSSCRQFLLVGGVDYESADAPSRFGYVATSNWRGYRRSQIDYRMGNFDFLPGSLHEVDELEKLLKHHVADSECIVLRGKGATEGHFKSSAPQAQVLHIATHGFYADTSVWSRLAAPAKLRERVEATQHVLLPTSYNFVLPGLMSGLAFAGVNADAHREAASEDSYGANDGFVVAEELSWLDLSNCTLAVLSACDTGRGQPVPGEHLLGLRRALRLAGVQSSMTSLWRIDDGATSRLMIDFYKNIWLDQIPLHEGLRRAQLSAIDEYRRELGHANPAAWGGFVIEGPPSWSR